VIDEGVTLPWQYAAAIQRISFASVTIDPITMVPAESGVFMESASATPSFFYFSALHPMWHGRRLVSSFWFRYPRPVANLRTKRVKRSI
jgi:hypothetical protein